MDKSDLKILTLNGQAQATGNRVGFISSFVLAALTALTFAVAICTLPLSGPFCTQGCFQYPFSEAVSRFPRDYYWMILAIFLMLAYVIWMCCLHQTASGGGKLFGLIGLSFALLSATVLIADYYIQLTVIHPALLNGEADGIALLTQFNPHGLFIALEEMGYLLMSVSFIFVAPVFSGAPKMKRAIRTVFTAGFGLAIGAFIAVLIQHGIRREYIFEVYVLSINWLVLIVNGILVGLLFRHTAAEEWIPSSGDRFI